jgi:hypothetical protein
MSIKRIVFQPHQCFGTDHQRVFADQSVTTMFTRASRLRFSFVGEYLRSYLGLTARRHTSSRLLTSESNRCLLEFPVPLSATMTVLGAKFLPTS